MHQDLKRNNAVCFCCIDFDHLLLNSSYDVQQFHECNAQPVDFFSKPWAYITQNAPQLLSDVPLGSLSDNTQLLHSTFFI